MWRRGVRNRVGEKRVASGMARRSPAGASMQHAGQKWRRFGAFVRACSPWCAGSNKTTHEPVKTRGPWLQGACDERSVSGHDRAQLPLTPLVLADRPDHLVQIDAVA